MGAVYYVTGRHERAVAAYRAALEINSNSPTLLGQFGLAYARRGMHAEAVAVFEHLNSVCDDHEARALLGYSYAAAGRRAEARRILKRLMTLSRRTYIPPFYIALLHAALGEKDAAFDWLERAYQNRDGDLTLIKVDPKVDCLRPDPRFARLLERLGLHT